MTPTDPLEGRLRSLDLQLPEAGEHLDAEVLAEITAGADPTIEQAAHLVGCDACSELLIVLAEGLADFAQTCAEEAPTATIHPFAPPRRRGRFTAAGLAFGFAVAAAATWGIYTSAVGDTDDAGSRLAPGLSKSPTSPTPVAPTPRASETTPTTTPPSAPSPPEEPPLPETTVEATPIEEPHPEPITPAVPAPTRTAKATKRTRRATDRAASADGPPIGLSGRSGPIPINRMPVNGAARGFGALRLNAKPSAQVFVDGQARGWTPILNLRLPSGPHDVRLVYESALAAEKEQRFRVLIQDNETWSTVRDNRRREQGPLDP